MRKKLLFVMPGLYGGGAEKSLVNLLNLLDYSKYEVDLLLFRVEGLFLQQVPKEVHILETPATLKYSYVPLDKEALHSISGLWAGVVRLLGTGICRLLNKENEKQVRWAKFYSKSIRKLPGEYDVALAYLHDESTYYVIDKVDAKRKIVWVHNDFDKLLGDASFFYKYFKKSDAVVSISDRCVEILQERFPDIGGKFIMLPNLTSSALIRRMADEYIPKEYDTAIPRLLSVGRLSGQKGYDFAIDAAAILKKKGVRFTWYVLGIGELEQELRQRISECNVTDCFRLLGIRENPYPYIQHCNVVVQPSRFEGKSVVLDETKILCKPIVVTDYATVRDQIEDGEEGMIVPMNAEGIADGIQRMLDIEELRNGYIERLRAHEYGNQDEVQKYMDLIDA